METIQLLDSDGNRIENPEYMPLVSDILDEDGLTQLRALYRDMVVVRRIDNESTALQRQGELALWAPLLGQRPRRSVPLARCGTTISPSPVSASTASPIAVVSNPRPCSSSGAVQHNPAGIRAITMSPRPRSSSVHRRCTPPDTPWA